MLPKHFVLVTLLQILYGVSSVKPDAPDFDQSRLKHSIDKTVAPAMHHFDIPGMAIALTVDGHEYFFNSGFTSRDNRQPISNKTLFEIGSLSKTFAATLATYAQQKGSLSLTDSVSSHLPALRGSSFDQITLLNLGTHTSGLPLSVPDNVQDEEQLMRYLWHWKSPHRIGSHRIYSNIGIGLLGKIAAQSVHESYDDAIAKDLFRPIGMNHSYLRVPSVEQQDYAQGYSTNNRPTRLNEGVLASEAYGVRTCTSDLIRFIEANMQEIRLDAALERAINATHTGYFKSGELTQDMVWEQYHYPVSLKRLLSGIAMTSVDATARKLNPPLQPQSEVLINKTGTTNGFAAYAAYLPARRIGIVILANRSYPADARVTAAYQILLEIEKLRAFKVGK